MLSDTFYWLFNMSLTASLTGLLVMLLRTVKRIPRRFAVLLWLIPFLRMAIPFGLNSSFSFMSLVSMVTAKTIVVYQPWDNVVFSMMNCVMGADTYFPIIYKLKLLENVFRIASVIWISISLLLLLILTVTYFTAMYTIKDAAHWKDNVYLSENIVVPAVFGIVKPKIILPASCLNGDAELIIAHEEAHISGFDNLWRLMASVICAVHWFNPISWLFLKCFLTDLEFACDERVLKKIGNGRAKEYALLLLESRQGTTVFASAFGGAKIRPRIENILSYQKLTWFSATVFASLTGIIFYVLLTNAG